MTVLGLPYPTIIGKVEGGEWASTVLDRVVVEGRYGVKLGQTLARRRGRPAGLHRRGLRRGPVPARPPGDGRADRRQVLVGARPGRPPAAGLARGRRGGGARPSAGAARRAVRRRHAAARQRGPDADGDLRPGRREGRPQRRRVRLARRGRGCARVLAAWVVEQLGPLRGRRSSAGRRDTMTQPVRRSGRDDLRERGPDRGELVGVERGDKWSAMPRTWTGVARRRRSRPSSVRRAYEPRRSVSRRAARRSRHPRAGRRAGVSPLLESRTRSARSRIRSVPPAASSWARTSKSDSARSCSASSSASSARISVAWAVRNVRQASMPGLSAARRAGVTAGSVTGSLVAVATRIATPARSALTGRGSAARRRPAPTRAPHRRAPVVVSSWSAAISKSRQNALTSRICSGGPAGDPQQVGRRDDDRQAAGARGGDVEPVAGVEEVHAARRSSSGEEVVIE